MVSLVGNFYVGPTQWGTYKSKNTFEKLLTDSDPQKGNFATNYVSTKRIYGIVWDRLVQIFQRRVTLGSRWVGVT